METWNVPKTVTNLGAELPKENRALLEDEARN